jgi:hypothetical protein
MMRTTLPAAEQRCMFSRVSAGARLLGRVSGTNVSRKCQQILCNLKAPAQQQWLASPARTSSSSSSSSGARPLAGKNIFQLRAAAEAVETSAVEPEQQQQQQKQKPKQQQQKQQKQPHAAQEAPKIVPLPTSDESEQLLRIRHSVSAMMSGVDKRQTARFFLVLATLGLVPGCGGSARGGGGGGLSAGNG